jgi:hypothetical protein
MEAFFRFNNTVTESDSEHIKKIMSVRGINKDSLNRLKSVREWFNYADIEVLKKVSLPVNGLNSLIEVDICGQAEIQFDYCDAMKKVFLLDLSEKWE